MVLLRFSAPEVRHGSSEFFSPWYYEISFPKPSSFSASILTFRRGVRRAIPWEKSYNFKPHAWEKQTLMDGYQPWGVSLSIQTWDMYKARKLHNISIAPKCPLNYQPRITNPWMMCMMCPTYLLAWWIPFWHKHLQIAGVWNKHVWFSGSVLLADQKPQKTGSRKHLLNFWLACAPVSGTRFPLELARCLNEKPIWFPRFQGPLARLPAWSTRPCKNTYVTWNWFNGSFHE